MKSTVGASSLGALVSGKDDSKREGRESSGGGRERSTRQSRGKRGPNWRASSQWVREREVTATRGARSQE